MPSLSFHALSSSSSPPPPPPPLRLRPLRIETIAVLVIVTTTQQANWSSSCRCKETSTTAPALSSCCRLAALELCCLCYLVLGFHLATALDIGHKQNGAYVHTIGHNDRRHADSTNGGTTINNNNNNTPLVTIHQQQQHAGEHLHKRSNNEINDKLVNHHRQSDIVLASLQSHIKHFSKIRTTEGGFKLADRQRQRQARDTSDVLYGQEGESTSGGSISTSTSTGSGGGGGGGTTSTTLRPWIHPDAIATPAETTPHAPMSPVHPTTMDTMGSNVVVFVLVLALVLATLGVLTCILSTYRYRTGGGGGMGGRARSELPSDTPGLLGSNANLPMLALPGGMCEEREVAALRDRHVRLKSVRTDMELDLPPHIRLPDGEELPYGCATRLHIRDPEQESEIYQKCVRPPPNRTVFDGESPPPYRSSSAGLLSHATPGSIDWAQDTPPEKVIRCHSMSSGSSRSGSAAPSAPSVVVPARSRRLSAFSDTGATGGALSQLTMVPCHRGAEPPV